MRKKLDILMRVPESFVDPPVFLDFFFSWSSILGKPAVTKHATKITSKKYRRELCVKR